MKTATRFLWIVSVVLLIALVLTPHVKAGGCRAVSRVIYNDYPTYTPVYNPVTVVKEIEKVNYINVARFVDVPLYNTFFNLYAPGVAPYGYGYPQVPYQPPQQYGAAPGHQTCEQKLQALVERLDRLEGVPAKQRGSMPKAETPPAGGTPEGPDRLVGLLSTNCAACHEAKAANSRGGDFVMFNESRLAQLTPEQVGKIIDEVSSGRMPKDNKAMPAAVRLSLVAALVSGK